MKYIKKSILISLLLILVFTLSGCKNNDITIKNVENHFLVSNNYGDIFYTGILQDNLPNGYGNMDIKGTAYDINMSGIFENGYFVNGDIVFNSLNKTVKISGNFNKNGLTGDGLMEIYNSDYEILKSGNFENNLLNGMSKFEIYSNGNIIYSLDGEFINDKIK